VRLSEQNLPGFRVFLQITVQQRGFSATAHTSRGSNVVRLPPANAANSPMVSADSPADAPTRHGSGVSLAAEPDTIGQGAKDHAVTFRQLQKFCDSVIGSICLKAYNDLNFGNSDGN